MIIDSSLEFCDAAMLSTSGTGTTAIGAAIDLGDPRDIGHGAPIYLVIAVDKAVTSTGAATVQLHLVSDAQDPVASDGSASVHWSSDPISKDLLVAGFPIAVLALPGEGVAYERYLGLLTTVGTEALSGGAINAFLTSDPHGWRAYPDAL